jgi:putative ABC transport system permease protein
LRALGLRRRAASALVAWEVGPVAVTALVVGTLLGCALPWLVLAGVDLRTFTHGTVAPAVTVDAGLLALVLGGFVVVVGAAIWVALVLGRRTGVAESLRSLEDG